MTKFDKWWEIVRHSGEGWPLSRMRLAEAGYKAGMLEAAGIAEGIKAQWAGGIGEGACDAVSKAIRQAVED